MAILKSYVNSVTRISATAWPDRGAFVRNTEQGAGLELGTGAEKFRKKTTALSPRRLIHIVELGRTYAKMGQIEEAKKIIRQGIAMPNREKDDPETNQRGQKTLDEIS